MARHSLASCLSWRACVRPPSFALKGSVFFSFSNKIYIFIAKNNWSFSQILFINPFALDNFLSKLNVIASFYGTSQKSEKRFLLDKLEEPRQTLDLIKSKIHQKKLEMTFLKQKWTAVLGRKISMDHLNKLYRLAFFVWLVLYLLVASSLEFLFSFWPAGSPD